MIYPRMRCTKLGFGLLGLGRAFLVDQLVESTLARYILLFLILTRGKPHDLSRYTSMT